MRGRASTVTDLGDGTVLRTGGAPAREAELMSLARAGGFPVPRVHQVRDDALIMERIDGPTMGRDIALRPWRLRRHMRTLAELHAFRVADPNVTPAERERAGRVRL